MQFYKLVAQNLLDEHKMSDIIADRYDNLKIEMAEGQELTTNSSFGRSAESTQSCRAIYYIRFASTIPHKCWGKRMQLSMLTIPHHYARTSCKEARSRALE